MSESTQSRDMCKDEVVLPTGLLADVRVRSWTAACDDVRTKDRATMAPFALASYLARRSSDAAIPVLGTWYWYTKTSPILSFVYRRDNEHH
jgi:hypothetical protein